MTQVELNEQSVVVFGVKHTFVHGTYNGMAILTDALTGFINATKFCAQFTNRRGNPYTWSNVARGNDWEDYIEEFENEYSPDGKLEAKLKKISGPSNLTGRRNRGKWWSYELKQQLTNDQNEFKGTYVDPRMINAIACRISTKYLITVGKIMDAIDKRVHDELKEAKLPDEPKHAAPMFTKIVFSFIDETNRRGQRAYESQYCWGCRD